MARIAVIGAGMGSLATTARLAAAGHRVTVYERAATYGGGVGRFERAGFAFDTGPATRPSTTGRIATRGSRWTKAARWRAAEG